MSTLPDIATVIPIKLAVIGSSGSESAIGDVQEAESEAGRAQGTENEIKKVAKFGVAGGEC